MIHGAHSIVYSKDPEADRAFFRDVLGLPSVDVGEGWLIFGLPPAEVAVHPSEANDVHELYLMCDDVERFVAAMSARGIRCGAVQDMGWGRLTEVLLPGGGKLGVYEPRHARPKAMTPRTAKQPKQAAKQPKQAAKQTTKPAKQTKSAAQRASATATKGSKEKRRKKAERARKEPRAR